MQPISDILHRPRPAITKQYSKEAGEGEAQGGPLSSLAAEPDLGDGQEDQGFGRRRHLLEVLAGRRSPLQLPCGGKDAR